MSSVTKILLKPFGLLYAAVTRGREKLYKKGFFKSRNLGAKTVSVGNITVGGTGKTPMVAYVARVLFESGEKVCVLTRGYGRENPRQRVVVSDGEKILAKVSESGDEPFELAKKLLGISAVVADARRAEAAVFARENFGSTAFVLDDAFQHFQVERNLDIVLIDATNPFGGGEVLPAGILREPLTNLKRADVVVITRANLVKAEKIAELKSQIAALCPQGKVFTAENRISKLLNLKDFHAKAQSSEGENVKPADVSPENSAKDQKSFPDSRLQTQDFRLQTQKSLAFCALGNPENFFEQLRRENFALAATRKFRDHYRYAQKDVFDLQREAKDAGAEFLLTTAKDAVKLFALKFDLPCFVVESEMVLEDEEGFRKLILKS